MPRQPLELTPTQLDDDVFRDAVVKIKKITPFKLAAYGLVSYTTIYKYIDRKPVELDKEEAIKTSMRLYNDDKTERDKESVADMKTLVS